MRLLALLSLFFVVAPAAGLAEEEPDPYRVTIDLTDSIHLLASDDAFEREPAEVLVLALGTDALPPLEAALEREDEPVRVGVIDVLESLEGRGATALLLARAKADPSVAVRAAAIRALISRVDPEAEEVVISAFESDDPLLYRAAFDGCARYCTSPGQLDRLVGFVFSEPMAHMAGPRGALLRAGAAPSRRPPVVAAVERVAAPQLESEDPGARVRAAMLFYDLGDPRALEPLSIALTSDLPVMLRLQAIVAFGKMGDESSVEKLESSLDALPPGLRLGACKALAMMATRDVPRAGPVAIAANCPGVK